MTKDTPLEDDGAAVEDDFMRYAAKWHQSGGPPDPDDTASPGCCRCGRKRCCSWKACCLASTVVWVLVTAAVCTTVGVLIWQDYLDVTVAPPSTTTTAIAETISTAVATATATTSSLF